MRRVKWTLWNVSGLVVRTNNLVEGEFSKVFSRFSFIQLGLNHRFNRLVTKYHPNVWHLFNCLKKEAVGVRKQLLKTKMGGKKCINKKTLALQQRIHSLETQFKHKLK
jgi:hypothetical protein